MKKDYLVKGIDRKSCEPFIMGIHYAKRWPSISYAFGLFKDGELVGVVTYGTPPSSTLRTGVAGLDRASDVLELNRLCLRDNLKNEASILVSRSLKLLNRQAIVVSFADTDQMHKGFVYQACNFKYFGLSAKRTDWKIKGMEHLHGQTISDEFRGVKNRAKAMREKYGDSFYLAPRSRKHRYIYCNNKKDYEKIIYKEESYPK